MGGDLDSVGVVREVLEPKTRLFLKRLKGDIRLDSISGAFTFNESELVLDNFLGLLIGGVVITKELN